MPEKDDRQKEQLPEARFSASFKVGPQGAYDLMVTVRDMDPTVFTERLAKMLEFPFQSYLPEQVAPATQAAGGLEPAGDGYSPDGQQRWCPIHETWMAKRTAHGDVWYSHKVGGEWCRGPYEDNQ